MKRLGFTIIELLVLVAIVAVILGLMLPAVRSSGEAARRMSCSNNIKQIGLGLHNYHSAHGQLPMQMGGTFNPSSNSGGSAAPGNNRYRISALVPLLPFIEQQAIWETVSAGDVYSPMGPAPWTREFEPWQTDIPVLRCPSDPGSGTPAHGRANLAFCLGDATDGLDTGPTRWDRRSGAWVTDRTDPIAASGRGIFIPRQSIRFRQILDGLSHTIMAAEIATDLGDRDKRTTGSLLNPWAVIHDTPNLCQDQVDADRPMFWSRDNGPQSEGGADQKRGYRWADGVALYTGFNTILPPNRETCLAGDESGIGMLTASSRHLGGAHVLMGDGAVVFITDSIDAGDPSIGTVIQEGVGPRAPGSPSPYGLWGALGTRAQKDAIEESLDR